MMLNDVRALARHMDVYPCIISIQRRQRRLHNQRGSFVVIAGLPHNGCLPMMLRDTVNHVDRQSQP